VVEAVKQGLFHIYAVSTIDEGIEVLTGVPAGERECGGPYPASSINGLVEKQLKEYSEKLKHAGAPPDQKGSAEQEEA